MQTLITATGKTYTVMWCAVSTIDNALRFAVRDLDIVTAFGIFSNSSETERLTCVLDEMGNEKEYVGYTKLQSIDVSPMNAIVVALVAEELE